MKNKNILLIKLFLVVVISPCFISCDRKANGFIYNGYGDIIGWYKKTGDTVTLPKPFRGDEHVEFDIDGNKVTSNIRKIIIPNDKSLNISDAEFVEEIHFIGDHINYSSFFNCNNLRIIKADDNENLSLKITNCPNLSFPKNIHELVYTENNEIRLDFTEYNLRSLTLQCDNLSLLRLPDDTSLEKLSLDCPNIGSTTLDLRKYENLDWFDISGCNIESIMLPNSLTRLRVIGCKNIKSIEIPASVKELYKCDFADCENLEQVVFKNKYTKVDKDTFKGCKYQPPKSRILE